MTAPSRFHAQRVLGATAEANPAYSGESPKEAQRHLSQVWAAARAAWARRGLQVYGLRTAEPHHDGCPHWHLVVYGEARALRYARRLLRVYALRVDGAEVGARKVRFKAMALSGGSAGASYAAKYIAKNEDVEPVADKPDADTDEGVDVFDITAVSGDVVTANLEAVAHSTGEDRDVVDKPVDQYPDPELASDTEDDCVTATPQVAEEAITTIQEEEEECGDANSYCSIPRNHSIQDPPSSFEGLC